jgi:hypothetical protein
MRAYQNWFLYKRKAGKKGFLWYYRAYDQFGLRTVGRGTGKLKRLVNDYCAELFRDGQLIRVANENTGFGKFAKGWWGLWWGAALRMTSLRRDSTGLRRNSGSVPITDGYFATSIVSDFRPYAKTEFVTDFVRPRKVELCLGAGFGGKRS